MVQDGVRFELEFDFIDHRLALRTDRGVLDGFALVDGLAVADFHRQLTGLLDGVGFRPRIRAEPFGVPMTTPFADDREHASYDPVAVQRFWRVLAGIADTFEVFAGRFSGKTSPVHLFWHSFDLALGRYSGRPAPERGGADLVTREAYSHEVISFGFWAGDAQMRYAAFYSYTAPEPAGLAEHTLRPAQANWSDRGGSALALLAYDDVCRAEDPAATLLDFMQSAYEAGASAVGPGRTHLVGQDWSMTLHRVEKGSERLEHLPLLLLADDAEPHVRAHLDDGDLYLWRDGGEVLGAIQAVAIDDTTTELTLVAVAAARQGRGVGRTLMAAVLDELGRDGAERIVVGTSNAGTGTLAFYQKVGFRLWRIERDYFNPARGYDGTEQEGGIVHRDLVWLDLDARSR